MAVRLTPPNMSSTNIVSNFMSLKFWFVASGIRCDELGLRTTYKKDIKAYPA